MTDSLPRLRGVCDLREFFRTNQTPVYFISPTAVNLLGIDRWVRNFGYFVLGSTSSYQELTELAAKEPLATSELKVMRRIDHREQKRRARELTGRLGDRLAAEGYVGFFEVDCSMTNVTAGAYADLPLFLFHLLEYLDVDYEVDIGEINERWSREASVDVRSQIIIKETADQAELLTRAPRTGIYRLAGDGSVRFARPERDWHGIDSESGAFYPTSLKMA
jgi:hypothetical protein